MTVLAISATETSSSSRIHHVGDLLRVSSCNSPLFGGVLGADFRSSCRCRLVQETRGRANDHHIHSCALIARLIKVKSIRSPSRCLKGGETSPISSGFESRRRIHSSEQYASFLAPPALWLGSQAPAHSSLGQQVLAVIKPSQTYYSALYPIQHLLKADPSRLFRAECSILNDDALKPFRAYGTYSRFKHHRIVNYGKSKQRPQTCLRPRTKTMGNHA